MEIDTNTLSKKYLKQTAVNGALLLVHFISPLFFFY